jgi:hypothetical protein
VGLQLVGQTSLDSQTVSGISLSKNRSKTHRAIVYVCVSVCVFSQRELKTCQHENEYKMSVAAIFMTQSVETTIRTSAGEQTDKCELDCP